MREAFRNSSPPPIPQHPFSRPVATLPTGACINAPVEISFRGRIEDALHLNVDTATAINPRRVQSSPRLSDLPLPMIARLSLDPRSMSAVFAFAGGGLSRGGAFTFTHEIADLWTGFRAGGLAWPEAGGPLPDRLSCHHHTEHESFRFELDLRQGWARAAGAFEWRRSERAQDAPAWLDRRASGVLTQAWSPSGHGPAFSAVGRPAVVEPTTA